jgi:hypothetical protein
MLPFHGTRASGAMRIDLPDPQTNADDFAEVALRALLQIRGVDAVAVVVYTDEPPQSVPDGILLPRLTLIEALLDVATDAGLRVVDALCVTADGWSDYLDDDPLMRARAPERLCRLRETVLVRETSGEARAQRALRLRCGRALCARCDRSAGCRAARPRRSR